MGNVGGFFVRAGLAAGFALALTAASAPAYADCYEGIGCTDSDMYTVDDLEALSCENLWFVRNRIYDENGYCFKTARAISQFDNSGCWVKNQANVKLSSIERHNVNAIVEAEKANGCN
jgi:YARHG domain